MPGGLPAPNVNVRRRAAARGGTDRSLRSATGAVERHDRSRLAQLPCGCPYPTPTSSRSTPWRHRRAATAAFAHVGTVIYELAVNPTNGALFASNTEARNEVRFAGSGSFGGSSVRGHLAREPGHRDRRARVQPRHLNPHIDYARGPSPPGVKERSHCAARRDDLQPRRIARLPGRVRLGDDRRARRRRRRGRRRPTRRSPSPARRTSRCPAAARAASCSTGRRAASTSWRASRTRSTSSTPPPAWRCSRCACTIPSRPRSPPAAASSTTPRSTRATARRRARSCHVFADVDGLARGISATRRGGPAEPQPDTQRYADHRAGLPPDEGSAHDPDACAAWPPHGAMHWRGDRTGGYQPGVDPATSARHSSSSTQPLPTLHRPRRTAARGADAVARRLRAGDHLASQSGAGARRHPEPDPAARTATCSPAAAGVT